MANRERSPPPRSRTMDGEIDAFFQEHQPESSGISPTEPLPNPSLEQVVAASEDGANVGDGAPDLHMGDEAERSIRSEEERPFNREEDPLLHNDAWAAEYARRREMRERDSQASTLQYGQNVPAHAPLTPSNSKRVQEGASTPTKVAKAKSIPSSLSEELKQAEAEMVQEVEGRSRGRDLQHPPVPGKATSVTAKPAFPPNQAAPPGSGGPAQVQGHQDQTADPFERLALLIANSTGALRQDFATMRTDMSELRTSLRTELATVTAAQMATESKVSRLDANQKAMSKEIADLQRREDDRFNSISKKLKDLEIKQNRPAQPNPSNQEAPGTSWPPRHERVLMVMRGWENDTPRAELEQVCRRELQKAGITPAEIWSKGKRNNLVYFKVDSPDTARSLAAQRHEFRDKDIRLWVAVAKSPAERAQSWKMKCAAEALRGQLGAEDRQGVEYDDNRIWAGSHRVAYWDWRSASVVFNREGLRLAGLTEPPEAPPS